MVGGARVSRMAAGAVGGCRGKRDEDGCHGRGVDEGGAHATIEPGPDMAVKDGLGGCLYPCRTARACSSAEERRPSKPWVGGSNPPRRISASSDRYGSAMTEATLQTNHGPIQLELFPEDAP